jgi:capsular polysaccharide biosynthesis protein
MSKSEPNVYARPEAQAANRRYPGEAALAALIGGLVAVLILGLGAGYVLTRPDRWSATTTLVLLPNKNVGSASAASYFDTLSTGQITSTASQIFDLSRFKEEAARTLDLSSAQSASTSVSSQVVVGSSILRVTVVAPTAKVAENLADTLVGQATNTVNALISPYQLSVLDHAKDSASRTGSLNLGKFLVVLVVVALAAGLGGQQALLQLLPLRRRRIGVERPAPDTSPPSIPPDPPRPSASG